MNNIIALPISFAKTNYLYFLKVTASILIFVLSVSYVFQINFEMSERFLVRQYEVKVAELLTQTRGLETVFAQEGSLQRIRPLLEGMSFQKADKTHYIQISDQQIVIR